MGVVLTHHGIEYLILLHRWSGHLRVSVLLWAMEGEGVRLRYGGMSPGGLMGRVGIKGGRIPSCVHGCNVGMKVLMSDRYRAVDGDSIESEP